jgi:hypothetical protein
LQLKESLIYFTQASFSRIISFYRSIVFKCHMRFPSFYKIKTKTFKLLLVSLVEVKL